MFPDELAAAVAATLHAAGLPPGESLHATGVERPLRPEHGDFSTPAALRPARSLGSGRLELAEAIVARLAGLDGVAEAWIAGAGHVNVRLTPESLAATARRLAATAATTAMPESVSGSEAKPDGGLWTPESDELLDRLAMLLRGARALDVPDEPLDLSGLAAPYPRRLICALAETEAVVQRTRRGPRRRSLDGSRETSGGPAGSGGVRPGRPHPLRAHLAEVAALWRRVERSQPVLPRGDEEPGPRHSTGRLLAEATFQAMSVARLSARPSSVII